MNQGLQCQYSHNISDVLAQETDCLSTPLSSSPSSSLGDGTNTKKKRRRQRRRKRSSAGLEEMFKDELLAAKKRFCQTNDEESNAIPISITDELPSVEIPPSTTNGLFNTSKKLPNATNGLHNEILNTTSSEIPKTSKELQITEFPNITEELSSISELPNTTKELPNTTNRFPNTTNGFPNTTNEFSNTTNVLPLVGHRAGVDAFTTGYCFTLFALNFLKNNKDYTTTSTTTTNLFVLFEEHVNKISLGSCKPIPLTIIKSHYSHTSNHHRMIQKIILNKH